MVIVAKCQIAAVNSYLLAMLLTAVNSYINLLVLFSEFALAIMDGPEIS